VRPAILLVIFGVVPTTAVWLAVIVVTSILLGVVAAYAAPARAPKAQR
jgi:hypothetical protein